MSGLRDGTPYTFAVQAVNAVGTGWMSWGSMPATPASVPGVPTSVQATADQNQATVQWTPPAQTGGRPITGYVVRTFENGSSVSSESFPSTAPTAVVSGLSNGVDYSFEVAASNAVGTGLPSGLSPQVTPDLSPNAVPSTSVHVVGNQLVNSAGQRVRLLGVDRDGTEYMCMDGGIFAGPSTAESVAAIASWGTNAVRIPLNEDCWLGINGVNPADGGVNYQSAIINYVHELNADGIIAILDLHYVAPGTEQSVSQLDMPDADHAPAFWTSVASTFESTPGVIFDLYNEPNLVSWSCWLNGCVAPGSSWETAGMQSLVNAVRATGADQPIMLGGLQAADDLSQWLAYEPVDPDHQLIASLHVYPTESCTSANCWNQTVASVAAVVPVVAGEIGEANAGCDGAFITSFMNWADASGVSYLVWTWMSGTAVELDMH